MEKRQVLIYDHMRATHIITNYFYKSIVIIVASAFMHVLYCRIEVILYIYHMIIYMIIYIYNTLTTVNTRNKDGDLLWTFRAQTPHVSCSTLNSRFPWIGRKKAGRSWLRFWLMGAEDWLGRLFITWLGCFLYFLTQKNRTSFPPLFVGSKESLEELFPLLSPSPPPPEPLVDERPAMTAERVDGAAYHAHIGLTVKKRTQLLNDLLICLFMIMYFSSKTHKILML